MRRRRETQLRRIIKTSTGWIHSTLILAIIIPLIFALFVKEPTETGPHLYLKCLVILLPVVITDYAADRCRSLLSYLLFSLLTFTATGAAAFGLAGSLRKSTLLWGYLLLLLCESLFVIYNRLSARLGKKKDREAAKVADPTFSPFYDILKEPSFVFLLYFGAVYLLAVNLNSPSVCNAALFSSIVYVPVTFLYQYVNETDHYLSLNKRTCNLPSRRIYMIGFGILAIYLLILLTLTLPSVFTISRRHYRDLREMTADIEIDYTDLMPDYNTEPAGEDFLSAMLAEHGNPTPPPWWVNFIFEIIAALLFIALAAALIWRVYTVFQDFRNAIDENGDIVETLQDTADDIRKIKMPASRRRLSEKEQIRKEYRRVIRRHRKDRPAVYESPAEIEERAGIVGTEEASALHARYEQARYGKG